MAPREATARQNASCAPALQELCRSLASASGWAPQALDAALGCVEASVTCAGASAWPLTLEMAPRREFRAQGPTVALYLI